MKLFNKQDKYFWIANIVIVLSLVVFFSRSLFTNRILAPGDFETYSFFVPHSSIPIKLDQPIGDPIWQDLPWFHFDRQVLRTGKLPLWNPYQGCGVPHIANMQSALFYPLHIFVYLLSWKWGLFFLYFFKLYFVGLFIFLYLREIEISPQVAIMFSIGSMYMSFNLIYLYFPPTNLAFFFPLAVWSIELIIKNKKQFKPYLLFCAGFVVSFLGGHPEWLFYSVFTLILYLLVRLYQVYGVHSLHEWLSILGKFFITLAIGILITSIQLLPFIIYFSLSSAYLARATLEQPVYTLPFYLLLFNILPTLSVSNVLALFSYVVGKYQSAVIFAYTGISTLFLGIAGIIVLNKDKIVRVFILILIVSLSVGFYIPFVHSLIIRIPGFTMGRNYYILMFAGWSLLVIGSKALDNFIAGKIKSRSLILASLLMFGLIIILSLFFIHDVFPTLTSAAHKVISYYLILSTAAALVLLIVTLWILKVKNRQLLVLLLGILIYAQTALPMIFIEPAIKPEYFYPKNKIFSMLRKEHGQPFRVTALISNIQPIAYATNINTFYKIEDIRNYDSLGLNWYNSIFPYIGQSDALNLTNVKYIIVKNGYDLLNFTNIFQPIAEYNGFVLYKNLSTFNRAYMIYNYAVADSQQQALDLLHTYSGQLNHVAIVFRKDLQGMTFTSNTQGTYKIAFIKYTPGYIKLSCTTSQPGLFFISDTYFPGWYARVDGKVTKIIRTDYAFQGLWLSQGTHTIELNYDPASFKYGALLSIIGILSLIGFYLIFFRKKKL